MAFWKKQNCRMKKAVVAKGRGYKQAEHRGFLGQ